MNHILTPNRKEFHRGDFDMYEPSQDVGKRKISAFVCPEHILCPLNWAMRGISSEILREFWLEIEHKGEHITTKTCEKGADIARIIL